MAQGYKEIKSNTLTAKFKKKGRGQRIFLAWTTTPWTLAANAALTVGPEIDYIKAEKDGEIFYLAKDLADKHLGEGQYTVLQEMKERSWNIRNTNS